MLVIKHLDTLLDQDESGVNHAISGSPAALAGWCTGRQRELTVAKGGKGCSPDRERISFSNMFSVWATVVLRTGSQDEDKDGSKAGSCASIDERAQKSIQRVEISIARVEIH